jgi:hypothetical protein
MTATALFAALAGSLTLAVMTDTAVAANYRDAVVARYAAEAAVEFALTTLAGVDDWSTLLEGGDSAWIDAPFRDLVPGSAADSGLKVTVRLADQSVTPGAEGMPVDRLSVVGEAFGATGTRRGVEAIVEKVDTSAVRLLAWRELP